MTETDIAVNSTSPSDIFYASDVPLFFPLLMSYMAAKVVLVLPPALFVLCLGVLRWCQHRSSGTTSHSDIFTYHTATVELIYGLGVSITISGFFIYPNDVMMTGFLLCYIIVPGETLFHVLTCVERYLAVVHPIVYLRLRQSGGVRIRNISIGCAWLLCFAWISVMRWSSDYSYMCICFFILSLVVVSFCSISVLCALIRPGPGEQSRDRAQADQSKRRAFYTVTLILGVQVLSFLGYLISFSQTSSQLFTNANNLLLCIGYWFSLPSSLVLLLLYLKRSRKLLCCKKLKTWVAGETSDVKFTCSSSSLENLDASI